jgi:hypothetical protein
VTTSGCTTSGGGWLCGSGEEGRGECEEEVRPGGGGGGCGEEEQSPLAGAAAAVA